MIILLSEAGCDNILALLLWSYEIDIIRSRDRVACSDEIASIAEYLN